MHWPATAFLLAAVVHVAAVIAAPTAAFAQSDSTPSAPEVWVHVAGPKGTLLLQQTEEYADWESACSAPCDKLLPVALRYRVGGGELALSPEFTLRASPGAREALVVDGGSKTQLAVGIIGLSVGSIVSFLGLVALALPGPGDGGGGTNWPLAGLALANIGVLTVAGGLALTLSNTETTVTQQLLANQSRIPTSSSWTQAPTRNTATEQKTLPPAVGVPILMVRF